MVMPGLINLDFADIRSVMGEMGKAMMGTGEGEGENRALDAAERAIANPLLDGVSMRGAKGVIISIIGGEDMKLLEVDEAANHIRELVDPEANIIWGSAFNPELEGRIRVSVVATGIEQTGEQAAQAARPIDLGAARGPKTPVLPLPTEEELAADDATIVEPVADDEFELTDELSEAAPDDFEDDLGTPAIPTGGHAIPTAFTAPTDDEFELGEEEEWDDSAEGAYASLTGDDIQGGGDGDELDGEEGDWDGAGDDADALELTMEAGDGSGPGGGGAGDQEIEGEAGPGGGGSVEDDLLLDASRLAEEDQPAEGNTGGRRRGLVSSGDAGGGGGGGASGTGSTLFERMANLSRGGTKSDDEEGDDDEDGSAINIPRFLGRQNNQ